MILFGPPVAEKIYDWIKKETAKGSLRPFLAVILVGKNPESLIYIRAKEKIAQKLGIGFRLYQFPENAQQNEVVKLLSNLNQNSRVSAIVVQLPLPVKFDTKTIINNIAPQKDVDGFSGRYPTPAAAAIMEILKFYKIKTLGKKIVLVGRGQLVGRPLEKLLINEKLSPVICDKETASLAKETIKADILISATGSAGLIKKEMVAPKVIIIDAGTSEVGGKISGDVDAAVYEKVSSYTPVPGGVGPVTVACLMKNVVEATKKAKIVL